jgi:hypothetical protein
VAGEEIEAEPVIRSAIRQVQPYFVTAVPPEIGPPARRNLVVEVWRFQRKTGLEKRLVCVAEKPALPDIVLDIVEWHELQG